MMKQVVLLHDDRLFLMLTQQAWSSLRNSLLFSQSNSVIILIQGILALKDTFKVQLLINCWVMRRPAGFEREDPEQWKFNLRLPVSLRVGLNLPISSHSGGEEVLHRLIKISAKLPAKRGNNVHLPQCLAQSGAWAINKTLGVIINWLLLLCIWFLLCCRVLRLCGQMSDLFTTWIPWRAIRVIDRRKDKQTETQTVIQTDRKTDRLTQTDRQLQPSPQIVDQWHYTTTPLCRFAVPFCTKSNHLIQNESLQYHQL